MKSVLKNHIEFRLDIKISKVRPVSGGDISQAFLLETETARFFCKVNNCAQADKMFAAEKAGLMAISKTKIIATPEVLLCEALDTESFLLMEYVEPKGASSQSMDLFGRQLAALHKKSAAEEFGWETDNYIGSLHQRNKKNRAWSTFYVQERLLPQLKIAYDSNGLFLTEIPSEEQLLKTCENLFPNIKPSLLHGDLWSGNYLIAKDGTPYLIDPATYFGHHEVDIAMTRLFGGFDASFYRSYKECLPEVGGEKERTNMYQLYYLLVHLNLFGSSYKASVLNILNHYF